MMMSIYDLYTKVIKQNTKPKKQMVLVHKRLGSRVFNGKGSLKEWLANGWKIKE